MPLPDESSCPIPIHLIPSCVWRGRFPPPASSRLPPSHLASSAAASPAAVANAGWRKTCLLLRPLRRRTQATYYYWTPGTPSCARKNNSDASHRTIQLGLREGGGRRGPDTPPLDAVPSGIKITHRPVLLEQVFASLSERTWGRRNMIHWVRVMMVFGVLYCFVSFSVP